MKHTLSALLLLSAVHFPELRAEPPVSVSRTFYVSGVECGACVYLVELSVSACNGVLKADVTQAAEGVAVVTFDPRLVTEHQIARAISEAMPLHGSPYLSRLRIRVGEYAKHVEALVLLFQNWRELVRFEVLNRNNGELLVHFLPMESAASKNGAAGWSAVQFSQVLQAGLSPGLTVEFLGESR
jgi:copper chaperone CopZ